MAKINLKPLQIVALVVMAIAMAVVIVADVFAAKYSRVISDFLGVTEQLDGDTTKIDEAAKSGDELVRKIADEGVVLLKNETDKTGKPTLPLPASTKNINLFGWGATDAGFLLAGNGSGRSYVHPDNKVTLTQAFLQNGFTYNEEIIRIYENHRMGEDKDWGEYADWGNRYNCKLKEPVTATAFPQEVVDRAKEFSDTAVVVISRYSGEYLGQIAAEQKKYNLPTDTERSFGQISTEEETLLQMCTQTFDNVIVVFNTGSMMDMAFLDDGSVGKIGAALNVGYMGQSGANAIPRILSGDVSPSGKLADTVAYEPQKNELGRLNASGTDLLYAEDIYTGYKFYETADAEGYFDGRTFAGKQGYDAVVQYPFGYGLSYTTFDWEVEELSLPEGSALAKDTVIELSVRVTNTGDTEGKDVVELYYTAPYYDGGIEKSAVNLLDFAKTPTLQPQQSAVVTFTVTPYDLASYDCYDKNNTGTTGWELDIGDYQLKLMTDSHRLKEMTGNTITYSVENFHLRYRKDPVTNGRIKNRYTGETAYGELPLDGSTLGTGWTYLSRGSWNATVPTAHCTSPDSRVIAPYENYWYEVYDYTSMPVTGVDAGLRLVTKADGSFVSLSEFTNGGDLELQYNDELMFLLGNPENWEDPTWDSFLNQLTAEDLRTMVEDGGYGTRAIESIGKPVCLDYDGPSGYNRTNLSPNVPGSKFTALPAENLVGQTWSKDLVYQSGQIVGMDGQNFGLAGIYAPGVNLHRESLNGRNYEYYSEDPVLSGYLAASFVKGAKSNGIYCYVKHLALYDSSPYTGQRVWLTEQNFRENYLKPFEIAVKKGGATGVMVAFNKIGASWAGMNQAMIDGILRTEFGFKGIVVTDYSDGSDSKMNVRGGLRAGLNTQLNPLYGSAGAAGRIDMSDVTDMNLARESAKSILYGICNAYYTAKTNTEKNEYSVEVSGPRATKMGFAWWVLVVVAINVVVFGIVVWRVLAMFLPRRKKALAGTDPEGEDDDGDGPIVLAAWEGASVREEPAAPPSADSAEPAAADEPSAESIAERFAAIDALLTALEEKAGASEKSHARSRKRDSGEPLEKLKTEIGELKKLLDLDKDKQ